MICRQNRSGGCRDRRSNTTGASMPSTKTGTATPTISEFLCMLPESFRRTFANLPTKATPRSSSSRSRFRSGMLRFRRPNATSASNRTSPTPLAITSACAFKKRITLGRAHGVQAASTLQAAKTVTDNFRISSECYRNLSRGLPFPGDERRAGCLREMPPVSLRWNRWNTKKEKRKEKCSRSQTDGRGSKGTMGKDQRRIRIRLH